MTEKKTSVDEIIGIVKTEEVTDSVDEVRKLRGRETMTDKRFDGVDIVKCLDYPITIWNREKEEWETIHMTKIGNTVYVSEEIYSELKKELE